MGKPGVKNLKTCLRWDISWNKRATDTTDKGD